MNHWKSVFCDNASITIEITTQWSEVPDSFWAMANDKIPIASSFLNKKYISAMSGFCQTWLTLFYENKRPIGWAVFYLSTFQSEELEHDLTQCMGIKDWIAKKWTNRSKEQSVLVCGNPLVSGEHGFVFLKGYSEEIQADILCDAMNLVVKKVRNEGIPLGICLMKDFYPHQDKLRLALKKCGFSTMEGDPVMMLPILPHWHSLADYQNDLISKFRSKSLTAFDKSKSVQSLELSWQEMSDTRNDWFVLYEKVYDRAQHKWKKLTQDVILSMKQNLGEQFVFRGYYLENACVGFSISILGREELEAHLVGFDYEQNRVLQLYSRMLYDFIDLGIQHKKSWVVFGRTALEIKSSVGALPLTTLTLLRHSKPMTNVLVRWLTSIFRPEEVTLRSVWKQESLNILTEKLGER